MNSLLLLGCLGIPLLLAGGVGIVLLLVKLGVIANYWFKGEESPQGDGDYDLGQSKDAAE